MAAKLIQEHENGGRLEVICSDEELGFIVEALGQNADVLKTGALNFNDADIRGHLEKKASKLREMAGLISLLIEETESTEALP